MVLSVAFPAAALVAPVAAGVVSDVGSVTASNLGLTGTAASYAAPAATPAAPVSGNLGNTFATSPTPGIINDQEFLPGGSSTEDPSIAYDTASFEPILNVYQTLINYNGTSTASFVPTLATCVPGTAQCGTDYPTEAAHTSDLVTYDAITGLPTAFTFVIDQAAKFYDPLNHVGWPVYPSDVVFSVDRTMAFADQPFVGKYNGWVLTQSLLPFGSPGFDSGIHFPWNNTPFNVLSSVLVNSSTFCPASAMSVGHGCVTFLAGGSGSDWPFFLQLVADDLGAGVEPCGVYTNDGAGVPGFAGSSQPHGDGPCTLPGGATSTDAAGFTSFLANGATGGNPYYWDSFENDSLNPSYAVQPGIQWTMTGSGPYDAFINVGLNYTLHASPTYVQPEGCAGTGGYAGYPNSYCDPAPGSFASTVNVNWEQTTAAYNAGIQDYFSGTADFATIFPSDATTIVQLSHTSSISCTATGNSCGAPWYHSNKVNVFNAPTITNFAFFNNFEMGVTNFTNDFPSAPTPQLPTFTAGGFVNTYFFAEQAVRGLLSAAYPYTSIESSVWTSQGYVFQFNAGGPIPKFMGNYYPTNFTRPYQVNGGNPDLTNGNDTGGALWWWLHGAFNPSPSNPYYSPLLASCLNVTCKFPIEGDLGYVSEDSVINAYIPEIEAATNNHLQPYLFDVNFATSLGDLVSPDQAGSLYYLGWAPDYPDPTDYISPYASYAGAYTGADSVSAVINLPQYNNSLACGHNSQSLADLGYWGAIAVLPQACQAIAWNTALTWENTAAPLPPSSTRVTDYDLISKVLDKLDLNVWQGQPNVVGTAAPWIASASINVNPTIGGGGDQLFFMLKYAAPLTVHRAGILAGTQWGINLGGQNYNTTGLTLVIGAAQGLSSFNAFSGNAPAGYALAHTVPLTAPNPLNVPALGMALTLVFAKTTTVTISETGLPVGTNWTVTLTPPLHWTPAVATGFDVVTSLGPNQVVFTGVVAGPWHYKVTTNPSSALNDFKTVPLGVISLPTGAGLPVPSGVPLSKTLAFSEVTAIYTFTETHKTSGASWMVSITGTLANGQPFSASASTTLGTLVFHLPDGTFSYSVSDSTSQTATPASGSFTLGSLHPWTPPAAIYSSPASMHTGVVFS